MLRVRPRSLLRQRRRTVESTGPASRCPPESKRHQHSPVLRRTRASRSAEPLERDPGRRARCLGQRTAARLGRSPSFPPASVHFRGVSCPTKRFCVAVGEAPDGNSGVALVTTNSGRAWTQLSLPRGEPRLSLVSCRSVTKCVVAVDRPARHDHHDDQRRKVLGADIASATDPRAGWDERSGGHLVSLLHPLLHRRRLYFRSRLTVGTDPYELQRWEPVDVAVPSLWHTRTFRHLLSHPELPVWWWAATVVPVASFSRPLTPE